MNSIELLKSLKKVPANAEYALSRLVDEYSYCQSEVLCRFRYKRLIDQRQKLAKELFIMGYNYSQIGRAMNRHRATIAHLVKHRKA